MHWTLWLSALLLPAAGWIGWLLGTRRRSDGGLGDGAAREAAFAAALRHNPLAVWLTSLPDGEILDVSDGALERVGFERDEVIGRTVHEINAWWSPEIRTRFMEVLRRDGEVKEMDVAVRSAAGDRMDCVMSARVVDIAGRTAMISVLRDVTAQLRAERQRRASEKKFAAAFRFSPDGVLLTQMGDGTILEVNQGFFTISGYGRDEISGRTIRDLGLWAQPGQRELMYERLERDGVLRDLDILVRRKDGAIRECVVSGQRVEVEGREILLSVVRDVTDRRRREKEIEAFNAELEAKNSELERFVYTVSHDLKNPLLTIQGFADLLEQDIVDNDTEAIADDIQRIRGAAGRMHRLLDELLELSRAGRVVQTPQPVAIEEVVRAAAEQLAGPLATRGVALEVEADLPTVAGDATRLLQVFENLLGNAVRFMGDQQAPKVVVGSRLDGPETVITVRDNGVGIEEKFHEQIFGLFDRLDAGAEGTGIGLALVRRITEVHGGRVWVESEGSGQGSTFCIVLPPPQTPTSSSAL
ncbi:MAG: PAS domain S-box protein [Acidobacteriota bacterium]